MKVDAIAIAALVLAILGLIKLAIVVFNAKTWLNVVKFLYGNAVLTFIAELVLAAVLFYYLLQSGMTIVPIMAVVAFGALLTGMTFAVYAKETIAWAGKFLNSKTLLRRAWLPILIWLALIVWTLVEIFG
jgi:hypothetical protein